MRQPAFNPVIQLILVLQFFSQTTFDLLFQGKNDFFHHVETGGLLRNFERSVCLPLSKKGQRFLRPRYTANHRRVEGRLQRGTLIVVDNRGLGKPCNDLLLNHLARVALAGPVLVDAGLG